MSLLAQWEKRVSDTMRTVGFLEAIERSARDIDTDPKRETVGEERERLKALLILVDQFLTINGFPTELSESFPEDAKKELADLLSRAEFSGCHLILTKLFRAIAFIKDFDKSRQFGRKTINQEEFEEQYTNLLASLHALHQSLKKYVHEVLTREHEGFSNALAGIPDASPAPESDLPDPPHAKSRNPRFPVEEIRPSGPARAPEHAKKLKGE